MIIIINDHKFCVPNIPEDNYYKRHKSHTIGDQHIYRVDLRIEKLICIMVLSR